MDNTSRDDERIEIAMVVYYSPTPLLGANAPWDLPSSFPPHGEDETGVEGT